MFTARFFTLTRENEWAYESRAASLFASWRGMCAGVLPSKILVSCLISTVSCSSKESFVRQM